MLEKQIERALVKAVKDADGLCLKWVSPGWDGAPDRIVLFGDGHTGRIGGEGSRRQGKEASADQA